MEWGHGQCPPSVTARHQQGHVCLTRAGAREAIERVRQWEVSQLGAPVSLEGFSSLGLFEKWGSLTTWFMQQ